MEKVRLSYVEPGSAPTFRQKRVGANHADTFDMPLALGSPIDETSQHVRGVGDMLAVSAVERPPGSEYLAIARSL